jgi:hypothetical protein
MTVAAVTVMIVVIVADAIVTVMIVAVMTVTTVTTVIPPRILVTPSRSASKMSLKLNSAVI